MSQDPLLLPFPSAEARRQGLFFLSASAQSMTHKKFKVVKGKKKRQAVPSTLCLLVFYKVNSCSEKTGLIEINSNIYDQLQGPVQI
jgi:hypothetical protein